MASRSSSILRTTSSTIGRRHLSSSRRANNNNNIPWILTQQQQTQQKQQIPGTNNNWMIQQQQKQYLVNNNVVITRQQRLSVCWFSDKTNTPNDEEKVASNEEVTSEEVPPVVEEDVADPLQQRINELEEKVKNLNDRLLRSLAEQDNTRRIAQRDVSDAKQYAIKSFAKGMLDVADNLDRALKAVPAAMVTTDKESHTVLANLYEGIEMTEKNLLKTFESNGLSKYGEANDTFDPNIHEALFEYPDSTKTPGTVGQIIKPGFMLNKRVLRPAEVGIIKKE